MFRYKTIIGRRLHARTLPNQKTEAKHQRRLAWHAAPGAGWLALAAT
jgi:hypothetical protein